MALSFEKQIKDVLGDKLSAEEVTAVDTAIVKWAGENLVHKDRLSEVSRERDDAKVQVTTLTGEIATLKKASESGSEIETKLNAALDNIKTLQGQQLEDRKMANAMVTLATAGAHDPEVAMAHPAVKDFMKTAKADDSGKIEGFSEFVEKTLVGGEKTAFMFRQPTGGVIGKKLVGDTTLEGSLSGGSETSYQEKYNQAVKDGDRIAAIAAKYEGAKNDEIVL